MHAGLCIVCCLLQTAGGLGLQSPEKLFYRPVVVATTLLQRCNSGYYHTGPWAVQMLQAAFLAQNSMTHAGEDSRQAGAGSMRLGAPGTL